MDLFPTCVRMNALCTVRMISRRGRSVWFTPVPCTIVPGKMSTEPAGAVTLYLASQLKGNRLKASNQTLYN